MTPPHSPERLRFFLGGYDLEMVTIRDLLKEVVPAAYFDKHLGWGAAASAYQEEIAHCLAEGRVPVLVELANDLGPDAERVIIIDHHGPRSGADAPSSLHQVFALLGLPAARWTRWFDLVLANDVGYIPALLEMGATAEEVERMRAEDRAAQGITADQEAEGARAAANREVLPGGKLTVIHLGHSRTAAAVDRLHPVLGGPGHENLLVCCPDEVNFFGAGTLVRALDARFPGGWFGGGPAGAWILGPSRALARSPARARVASAGIRMTDGRVRMGRRRCGSTSRSRMRYTAERRSSRTPAR